jgi:hypothetical protein
LTVEQLKLVIERRVTTPQPLRNGGGYDCYRNVPRHILKKRARLLVGGGTSRRAELL